MGQCHAQVLVHGSRITVVGSVIGTLVRIEKDAGALPFELVAGAAVRLQRQYVWSHQIA